MLHFAIAGAGFSGAVLARELAEVGHRISVFEARSHVAGNCFTQRDPATGILVHRFGPHIFHTDDEEVWRYVNRFSVFIPYINRVKTTVNGAIFSLPINLHTINQFFGTACSPTQARALIASKADQSIDQPKSFREQALKFVGQELYEAFLAGYTRKQWGREPDELPASILQRLPVRFDYNDNYFAHRFQGLPVEGYTPLVQALLDHPSIELALDSRITRRDIRAFDHTFYSGALDEFFEFEQGHLSYRTLDFEEIRADGDFQGCAVMNYGDLEVPWTRITEHKHFAPREAFDSTVCYREFSRECGPDDIRYYPVRLVQDKQNLSRYIDLADGTQGVTFVGRLGTYRDLDMDVTIREALDAARPDTVSGRAGAIAPCVHQATDLTRPMHGHIDLRIGARR